MRRDFLGDPSQAPLGRNLTLGLVESLGTGIVGGRFGGGSLPSEVDLAKRYSVSRSVVREAIKILTSKGLLRSIPRIGAVIQPISRWNLFDTDVPRWLLGTPCSSSFLGQIEELRGSVEPMAAAVAASVGGAGSLTRIREAVHHVKEAIDGVEDAVEAEVAFHSAVLQASANPFFVQLSLVFETASRASARLIRRQYTHRYAFVCRQTVADAIAWREPDRANKAMLCVLGPQSGVLFPIEFDMSMPCQGISHAGRHRSRS